MEITDEVRKELRKPFPKEAISQHPTKTFLSTIKAIYVTERLNDVFGIGGWTLDHEVVSDTEDYVTVKGRLLYGRTEDDKRTRNFNNNKRHTCKIEQRNC